MSAPFRLLVVDDEASIRALVKSALTSFTGIVVTGAQNGADAINQLLSSQFDLVLLDLTMPIINGLDTLRAIRANEKLKLIPVLILTGRADEVRIREAITMGIVGCLIKPFSLMDLRERVVGIVATVQRPDGSVRRRHQLPVLSESDSVLLVDQGVDVREINQALLARLGNVVVDQNEFAALARCANTSFRAVILGLLTDWSDPKEVARRFRQIAGLDETVLAALAPPGDLERIQEANCFDLVLPRRLTASDCEQELSTALEQPSRARLLFHNDSPWLQQTFEVLGEEFRQEFGPGVTAAPGPMRGPWVHSVIVNTELQGPGVDRILTVRSPITAVMALAARRLSAGQDGVSNVHMEQAMTEFGSRLAERFVRRAAEMSLECVTGRQSVRIVHVDRRQGDRAASQRRIYHYFDDAAEYGALHLFPAADAQAVQSADLRQGESPFA